MDPTISVSLKFTTGVSGLGASAGRREGRRPSGGRDSTCQRPTFTAGELRDLIAYLSPVTGGATAGPVFVLPGDPGTGRVLFAEKQCVQCHAAGGTGGSVGPSLTGKGVRRSPLEFAAAMWNKAPAMTAAMASRGVTIPQLTPVEMADVVAYLYSSGYFAGSGSPNRGWATLSGKGCLACHGVFGEPGKPASDLTAATGPTTPARVLADLWNHTTVTAPSPGGRQGAVADLPGAGNGGSHGAASGHPADAVGRRRWSGRGGPARVGL